MGESEPSHLIGRRWCLNRDGNPHIAQLVVLYGKWNSITGLLIWQPRRDSFAVLFYKHVWVGEEFSKYHAFLIITIATVIQLLTCQCFERAGTWMPKTRWKDIMCCHSKIHKTWIMWICSELEKLSYVQQRLPRGGDNAIKLLTCQKCPWTEGYYYFELHAPYFHEWRWVHSTENYTPS